MADDPTRVPYTGQLGTQPQPPPNPANYPQPAPQPTQTSNSQLAGRNYDGTPRTQAPAPPVNYSAAPAAPYVDPNYTTIKNAHGRDVRYFTGQTSPNASNNLGFGAGNVNRPDPNASNFYTAGGNYMPDSNPYLTINPDTGQPYLNGDQRPNTFTGTGGLTQFGNPNLAMMGGDPNNYGTGLGGQYSYTNVQNAKLQGMAQDAFGRTGPQAQMGATNMFAGGTGNALQHADSTNLLGINAAQNANATNLLGVRQGLDMAGLANGQAANGQLQSAGALMNMSQMPAGPSVAEQQLRMGGEANMRQQMAMAAGARGGNAGLALQNAGQNVGAANAQLNGQMGIQRAQEDMANRQFSANAAQASGNMFGNLGQTQQQAYGGSANIFGNVANNQLGQGQIYGGIANNQLGQANTNLGLTNTYAGLAGQQLGADVTSRGQNDQLGTGLMGMGYGMQASERAAAMQQQQGLMDLNAQLYGANTNASQHEADRSNDNTWKTVGTVASTAGPFLAAAVSDIRAKKNIKPAGEDVSNAFRSMNRDANTIKNTNVAYPNTGGLGGAYSYEYKNPNAPGAKPGTQYGPMAQDLEQTPAGASVVSTGPDGMKGIDTQRLSLMSAAELAKQRQELDAIMAAKNLTVDRRAPTVTQLPQLNPANFGQYGAPNEAVPYAAQHAQVYGYDMDGNPVTAKPPPRIGFQPGQLGYGV